MKRIAIVFEGGLDSPTGLTNAVINRVVALKQSGVFRVDVYDILSYPTGLAKSLMPKSKFKGQNEVVIDGLSIKVLWFGRPLVDAIIEFKLHKKPYLFDRFLRRNAHLFSSYDLISAHAFIGAKLAFFIKQKYEIPFCVTWHGSEVHSIPDNNAYQKALTRQIMEFADSNFFVSRSLCEYAEAHFTKNPNSEILYNGVSSLFYRHTLEQRLSLRHSYSVENQKVVAFVGNLVSVKNAALLPEIFKRVRDKYEGRMAFWIIGRGSEYSLIEQRCSDYNLPFKMWGYQGSAVLSQMLQCVDVVVLPSKEEGLGMVLLEAISCGASAVGSDVGGIPEVIGKGNSISLGADFVERFSDKVLACLEHPEIMRLDPHFSWTVTAKKETESYMSILNGKN